MADEVVRLAVDSTEFVRGSRNATTELKRLSAESRTADRDLRNLNTSTKRTATDGMAMLKKGLAALGLLSFIAVMRRAIGVTEDFAKAMAEVSTLLDDTSSMDQLTASVKELTLQYGGDAVTNAKALYQIISAGASNAAEATKLLDTANRLAIGGVTDVATAADGLTSILNAYGKSASEANDVSDALFVAMKAGKTTIAELSQSIGRVAPVAANAGVSLEELLAAISAITKGGINTVEVVTGMRAILSNIIAPSTEAAEAAKQYGVELSAAALQAKGFQQFMREVVQNTNRNTDAIASIFGEVRALVPVLALAGEAGEDFNDIIDDMANKAGITQQALDKMMPTRTLDRFKEAKRQLLDELGQGIARILLPAIEKLSDHTDDLVLALRSALDATIALAAAFLLLKARMLAVTTLGILKFYGAYVAAGGAATLATTRFVAALNLLKAHPILIGGTLLTAGIYAIRKAFSEAKDEADAVRSSMQRVTEAIEEQSLSMIELRLQTREFAQDREREQLASLKASTPAVGAVTWTNDQIARLQASIEARQQEIDLLRESGMSLQTLGGINVEVARTYRGLTEEQIENIAKLREQFKLTELEVDAQQQLARAVFKTADAQKRIELQGKLALDIARARLDITQEEYGSAAQSLLEERIRQLQAIYDIEIKTLDAQKERAKRRELAGIDRTKGGPADRSRLEFQPFVRGVPGLDVRGVIRPKAVKDIRDYLNELNRARAENARYAKAMEQIAEAAARGIQEAFAGAFRQIFTDGLAGFDNLADAIVNIFRDVAAQVAALWTAEKLGINKAIANLQAGLPAGLSKTKGSIIAGVGGLAYGYSTGSPLGGAAAGAASGAALGGAPGAVVGGIAGLVGGLFGQAKKAREAAARMKEALRLYVDALRTAMDQIGGASFADELAADVKGWLKRLGDEIGKSFSSFLRIASPEGMSQLNLKRSAEDIVGALEQLRDRFEKGSNAYVGLTQLIAYANKRLEAFAQEMADFGADLDIRKAVAEGRNAEADAMRRQLAAQKELREAIERGYDPALITKLKDVQRLEAERAEQAFALQDQQAREDAEVRRLSAMGATAAAEALRRQYDREREIQAARDAGLSDTTIATLKAAQAEEELAAQRAIAAERSAFADDLALRRAKLSGDEEAALRTELEIRKRQELDAARKLVDAGIITEDMFSELASILDGEVAQAIQSFVDSMAEMKQGILDDIALRELIVDGREDEAELLRLQIRHQEELKDAIDAGLSDTDIKRLERLQEKERERLIVGSANVSATGSTPDAPRELSALADSVRRVSETSAIRLGDLIRSSNVYLSQIASNTAALRGSNPAGTVYTGVTGGVTVNFNAPVTTSDPDKLATLIAARVNRQLASRTASQVMTAGDAERIP